MIGDIAGQPVDRGSMRPTARDGGEPQEGPPALSINLGDAAELLETAEPAQDNLESKPMEPGKLREKWEQAKKAAIDKAREGADFLDDHPAIKGTIQSSEQVLKGIKAFPKFIYPSFEKMTAEEVRTIYSYLDKLPLKDVNSVDRIQILPELKDASGLAYRNPAEPFIQLSRQQLNLDPHWAETVTVHEVGHTKDYETALFGIFKHESTKTGVWGKGPWMTDYAKTNHWEDFAETHAFYHLHPEELKTKCPEKYARMAELEKLGTFDRLIDRQAFRETGKYIGEKLGDLPYLRSGVDILSFALGFLQIAKGFGELEQGVHRGDLKKKMDGTLDIAAGTCFASKIFCVPGLAIDGAKQALDRAIDKGDITSEQGNALVQHTIGAIGGPLAKIAHWVKSKFSHKPPSAQAMTPAAPATDPEKKLSLGTVAKAATIAAGGAAGSVGGGIVGPYMGLMAGFSVAGPLGGALGLVIGCLTGILVGNKIGGEAGSLIGELFVKKPHV
jgi:hypothetical protein